MLFEASRLISSVRVGAYDLEDGLGYALMNTRKDLSGEIQNRISIRGMIEATDKDDVAPRFVPGQLSFLYRMNI